MCHCSNSCHKIKKCIVDLNHDLILRNYKILGQLINVFEEMKIAVENHKVCMDQLIATAETNGEITLETIDNLDKCVMKLLNTLSKILDTKKCQESNLGSSLINSLQDNSDDTHLTNACYANHVIISIPIPMCVSISNTDNDKEINIKLKIIGVHAYEELCFPLTCSSNICTDLFCNLDPSGNVDSSGNTDISGCDISGNVLLISIDFFIEKIKREINMLLSITNLFCIERDRFNCLRDMLKIQAINLINICPCLFNKLI